MNLTMKRWTKCAWIVAGLLAVIMIAASAFTVPVADDFATYQSVTGYQSPLGHLGQALHHSGAFYMTWQGTYFSCFLDAILSPLTIGGMWLLRIEMMVHSVLVFGAIFFFLRVFTKVCAPEDAGWVLPFAYVLFMVSMTCFADYNQVWFWFNASCVHSLPILLMLFSLGFVIRYVGDGKVSNIVIAGIIAAAGLGGVLVAVGAACYLLLMMDVYLLMSRRKLPIPMIVLSVEYLVLALVNTLAPGNFARHTVIDSSGVHPMEALKGTFKIVSAHFLGIRTSYALWAIALLFLLIGLYAHTSKQVNRKAYITCSILMIGAPYVAVFPLALGYSSLDLTVRASFTVDIMIYLTIYNLAFLAGRYIDSVREQAPRKLIVAMVGVLVVLSLGSTGYTLQNVRALTIAEDLASGKYSAYYNDCQKLFEKLEKAEGDVVIHQEDFPVAPANMREFYLTGDPTAWENVSAATYFGVNTIRVE